MSVLIVRENAVECTSDGLHNLYFDDTLTDDTHSTKQPMASRFRTARRFGLIVEPIDVDSSPQTHTHTSGHNPASWECIFPKKVK